MASSTSANGNDNTRNTSNSTDNTSAETFASLLAQVPDDSSFTMNRFLHHNQAASVWQYERAPLGLRPTESPAEVEARVTMQLRNFDAQYYLA